MSSNQYLIDGLTRHQVYVQRYGGGVWRKIRPILVDMRDDIKSAIGAGGTEFQLSRLSALYQAVNDALGGAEDAMIESLQEEIRQFSDYEVRFNVKFLGKATSADFALPDLDQLAAAVSSAPMVVIEGRSQKALTIDQAIRQFTGNKRREIRNIIAAAVARGDTTDTIARAVARSVNNRTASQAESLVRTVVNHTANVARAKTHEANSDVLQGERYIATLDQRTTLTCAGFDGEVFSVGQGPIPPMHFNCRSTRIPEVRDEFKIPGLKGERAATGGPEPASSTFDSWLRRQDEEFQNETLGPERAKLFRSGTRVDKFTNDMGVPLTLEELAVVQ